MNKQTKRTDQAGFLLGTSRYFLSFFCSILLFGFLVLLGIRLTLFSESFMEKQAAQANYYETLTKEINRQIQDIGLGSNVPEAVLENAVQEDLVARSTQNYFHAVYLGNKFKVNGEEEIRKTVTANVNKYAQKEGIMVSEESKQAIEKLADEAIGIYKSYVQIPFFLEYGKRLINFSSLLSVFLMVVGTCLIIVNIFLLYLLRQSWHRYFRFVSYSFLGAGLMLLIGPGIVIFSNIIERINIHSESLYSFLISYVNGFFKIFFHFGIIVFVLGLVLFIMSEIRRKRKLTVSL